MKKLTTTTILLVLAVLTAMAQEQPALPPLHAEGRHLVTPDGHCVMLRGVMYGPHPYFNGFRWGDGRTDADVANCLSYFHQIFDALADTTQGSYCNMLRTPIDSYWTDTPGATVDGPGDISAFDKSRMRRYLDKLFLPLIEDAVAHGLYVVLRPPYGNTGTVQVGDAFQQHLVDVWRTLAHHNGLRALSGQVLFELLNEPTVVLDADGHETPGALTDYLQPVVDAIRAEGYTGVILAPGLAFQSKFEEFVAHPLADDNLGFAVHVYPGWYDQDDARASGERMTSQFQRQVPVLKTHPVVVTEVDWSPEKEGAGKYNEFGEWVPSNWGTWGTGSTSKWGVAYKAMLDYHKNVSTVIGSADCYFDIDRYLSDGTVTPFFDDNPECCAHAAFEWFSEWAHAPMRTPVELDAEPDEPHDTRLLTSLDELTTGYFQLVNGQYSLCINSFEKSAWDMTYLTTQQALASEHCCYLFRLHPVEVDGQTLYQLKCYYPDGTLRMSNLDAGVGDAVNITTGQLNVFFIGSSRLDGPYQYGQDLNRGSLWEVEPADDGFTFRSASANHRYLGPRGVVQSSTPSTWHCYSRYSFETATGVEGVSAAPATADGCYYTLGGQRVAVPKRGIYVRNGQKVIIK